MSNQNSLNSLNSFNSLTIPITHTHLSIPISAVLRAGDQPPGLNYSKSPTIINLTKILFNLNSKSIFNSNSSLNYYYYFNQNHQIKKSIWSIWWENLNLLIFKSQFFFFQFNNQKSSSLLIQNNSSINENQIYSNVYHQNQSLEQNQNQSLEQNQNLNQNQNQSSNLNQNQSLNQNQLDSFKKPKFPLILCHGLFGFDYFFQSRNLANFKIGYSRGVKEALEEKGVEVYVARVPASASIEERAKSLAQFIESKVPGKTVNLIGHSMGGLDSRFLISHLKPTSFKVASLTTIGTPHRGSAFADYIMLDLIGRENLPKFLQLVRLIGIPGGGKAFEELTMESMKRFNDLTPDDENVEYYSFGACFQPSFTSLFKLPWSIVFEREGPNDGLVSINSAKWGQYQATLENVNHADLVGWNGIKTSSYSSNDHQSTCHGFQAAGFFLQVAELLAEKGF